MQSKCIIQQCKTQFLRRNSAQFLRRNSRGKLSLLRLPVGYGGDTDYFMVGECVRFLFTSCEGSLNERVSAAN